MSTQIPEDWRLSKLPAIAEFNPESVSDVGYEESHQYVTLSDVSTNNLTSEPENIDMSDAPSRAQRIAREGDVLLGKVRPPQESHWRVPDSHDGVVASSGFTSLRTNENSFWLVNSVLSSPVYRQLNALAIGGGYPSVNNTDLNIVSMPVPPLPEQERIASVLYSVDEHVRTLEERHDTLTDHKQALMQELLKRQTEISSGLSVRSEVIKGSEESDFDGQTEWNEMSIDEAYNFRDSERAPLNSSEREEKTDGQNGEIPYFGANGVVDYIDEYIFDSELILVAEDGGHFHKYSHRPVSYMIEGKSWVNNHAHVLETASGVNNWFGFYSLEHKNLVSYVTGSTRAKLTKGNFKLASVSVPSLWKQERIASVLYTMDEMIARTASLRDEYERLKQGLMQDLLSGKVRTPEALRVDETVVD